MKASLHRPSQAVVDLSAIYFNIEQIISHIPEEVEKWAVVKANANEEIGRASCRERV